VLNRNLESWFSRPARGINIDLTQVGSAMDQEVRDKLNAQAHWLGSLTPGGNSDSYQRFAWRIRLKRAEIESPKGVTRVLCSQAKMHDGELYTARLKTDQGVLTLSARMPLNLAAKQSEIQRYVAEYNRLSVDRRLSAACISCF